jgi:hypothetical protein
MLFAMLMYGGAARLENFLAMGAFALCAAACVASAIRFVDFLRRYSLLRERWYSPIRLVTWLLPLCGGCILVATATGQAAADEGLLAWYAIAVVISAISIVGLEVASFRYQSGA